MMSPNQSHVNFSGLNENSLKKHLFWITLCLFTAIGFLIRFYIGRGISFWTDEGQYIEIVGLKSIGQFIDYYYSHTSNDQPALTYIFVYFWKSLVGITPERLRLLPTIVSTFSIFATAYFCYHFSKSRSLSLMMAVIIMLSPYMVRYSYDLSSYCFVGLFAPISFFLFLTSIRHQRFFWSSGGLIVNALLLNTHYISYFYLLSQGIIFIFFIFLQKKHQQLGKLLLGSILLIIAALLPFSLMFSADNAAAMQSWMSRLHIGIWGIISQTFTYSNFARIFVSAYFVIILIRFFSLFERYDSESKNILCSSILCFIFTLIIAWVVQIFTWRFIGHARHLMVTFPILFFFMLYSFQGPEAWKPRLCTVILLVIVFIVNIYKFQPYQNQDFRSASTYIKSRYNDQSAVYVIPFSNVFRYYFYIDKFDIKFDDSISLNTVALDPSLMTSFVENLKKNNTKKIIFAHTFVDQRIGLMNRLVKRDLPKYFTQAAPVKHFDDIDIYEFNLK